jgi:hypothetical protein
VLSEKRDAGPVLVVDAGGSLAPRGRMAALVEGSQELAQRRIKAELIASAWALGGIDGIAVGGDDWNLGRDFVFGLAESHSLPVLAANLVCGGERPLKGHRVVEVGGHKVGLVGVTTGEVEGCTIGPPDEAMRAAVAAMGAVDLVIGLTPAERAEDVAVLGESGIDVVFDGRGRHTTDVPDEMGDAWAVGSGTRGKYVGFLEITFVPGAERFAPSGVADSERKRLERVEQRMASLSSRALQEKDPARKVRWENQVAAYEQQAAEARAAIAAAEAGAAVVANGLANSELALSADVEDHAVIKERIDAALQEIIEVEGGTVQFHLEPHVAPPDSPYAGSDACVACHKEQHLQWSTTAHAHAWQTLVIEKRHLDRDCFSCHATGVSKPGGPAQPGEVVGLRDVQCEACHGAAGRHVAHPGVVKPLADPGLKVCQGCHDGEQDGGRFDFPTYRPKIVHGTAAE